MRLNLPLLLSGFRPGMRMTLFVLVFIPLTLSLGLWQLDRADEKRDLQDGYLAQLTKLATVPSADLVVEDFMRLRLTGVLTEQIFLVDNQVNHGRTGYWVVQVLAMQDGQRWLVNRGFLEGSETREVLPDVDYVGQTVEVIGVVWPDTGLVPLLAGDPWTGQWPERVQRLNIARMADVTDAYPVEVRLEQSVYVQQPAPFDAVLSEDKHLGYAATWFGLALALGVLYIFSGLPRREKS